MNKECKVGYVNLVYFECEWNIDNCFEILCILIIVFFKLNKIYIDVWNDWKFWGENGLFFVGYKL